MLAARACSCVRGTLRTRAVRRGLRSPYPPLPHFLRAFKIGGALALRSGGAARVVLFTQGFYAWLLYTLGISARMLELAPLVKLNYAILLALIKELKKRGVKVKHFMTFTVARVLDGMTAELGEVVGREVRWAEGGAATGTCPRAIYRTYYFLQATSASSLCAEPHHHAPPVLPVHHQGAGAARHPRL